jgi:putative phosphoribosyl transferase
MEKALKAAGAWFGQHLRRERPFFEDRETAGRMLAARLMQRTPLRPVVYALPRGGVPVAIEIAKRLNAPLDLLLVRKIGVPGQPELAAGAVVDGEQPDIIVNEDICRASGLRPSDIAALGAAQLKEIERRRALYLPGKAPAPARGRTAILVDDGVATGASMEAAIAAVRRRSPERIIVAVPVASRSAFDALQRLVEEVLVLDAPENFDGVGEFYRDFHQLDDEEVIALLANYAPDAGDGETGRLGSANEPA